MKQTIPVFLHASPRASWEVEGPPYNFRVWPMKMDGAGAEIFVCETKVEFEVPTPEQVVAKHAVLLREKIKETYADAEKKVASIREELAKLEALTYEPSDS